MPLVTVKLIPNEKTTAENKARLMAGMTQLLADIMDKPASSTWVVIEEVPAENWGTGGVPLSAQWAAKKA